MHDLHTHTTASDGVLSPTALLERALKNGVTQLAITDHDSVAGYLAVADTEVAECLTLISGVELSTLWRGVGVHVVGLDFDARHPQMTALLAAQAQARKERALTIVEKLAKRNMPIDFSALADEVGAANIGRPHIAAKMVEKGYVKSVNRAFSKYLGAGKIGDVNSAWCALDAGVAAIVNSGGVAVLAHPDHYKMTRTKLLALMTDFKEAGGQAIEVISGRQHKNITEKLTQIAKDKGFYASLGSDFHRPLSYAADVGELPPLPAAVKPVWDLFKTVN